MSKFERRLFGYFDNLSSRIKAGPLNLGGIAVAPSGSTGGPPGGFIGYVPQTRISYDTTEAEISGFASPGAYNTSGVLVSASLLDNLNHIRYRLAVLESAAGAPNLFLHNELSDIGGYESLLTIPANDVEDSDTVVVNNGDGEVLIDAYITDSDGLLTTILNGGIWTFHTWAYVDNLTGTSEIILRVYKRNTAGTETELFNTSTGEIDAVTATEYVTDYVATDYIVLPSDRIVVKYFAKTTSVTDRTITLHYEGTEHYSHIHTPFGSPDSVNSASVIVSEDGTIVVSGATVLNFINADVTDAGSGQANITITGSGGGSTTFLGLTDTPSSYSGQTEKFVRVNASENALEFVDAPTGSGISGITIEDNSSLVASDVTTLNFVGTTVTDEGGGYVTVAVSGGGASTFLNLTDTPSSYSGQGEKHVRVNVSENALEFVDAPTGSGISGIEIQEGGSTVVSSATILNFEGAVVTDQGSGEALITILASGISASGIGAIIYNNANISIPNNSETLITFNTEEYDSGGFYSAGQPSRLTAPQDGLYFVGFAGWFLNNSTGFRYVNIYKNATNIIAQGQENAPSASYSTLLSAFCLVYLTAGEYVTATVLQDSGSSLNLRYVGDRTPYFYIALLTPGGGSAGSSLFPSYLLGDTLNYYSIKTANYNNLTSWVKLSNGKYMVAYRRGTTHISDKGIVNTIESTDHGKTWTNESTAYTDATYDTQVAGILQTSAGTVIITFSLYNYSGGSTVVGSGKCIRSTDLGETWDSPVTVTTTFDADLLVLGEPIQLQSGKILQPIHGRNSGDTYWSTAVVSSSNDGVTWGDQTLVADGDTDSIDYSEMGLVQAKDGTVIGIIRGNNDYFFYRVTSSDDGATWSFPVRVFSAWGNPRMVITGGDVIHICYRKTSTYESSTRTSYDLGETWTGEHIYDINTYNTDTYSSIKEIEPGRFGIAYANETGTNTSVLKYKEMSIDDQVYPYFINLMDAPVTLSGHAGEFLVVNAGGTALELTASTPGGSGIAGINVEQDGSPVVTEATILNFIGATVADAGGGQADITITASGGGATTFLGLTDTPGSFSGQAGKVPAVNVGEDALEFITVSGAGATTFLGLTDSPSSYSGQAGKVVAVNSGENSLEFVTASGTGSVDISVSLSNSGSQSIGTGAYTDLSFDTEEYDTDTMHDTVTNNNRITINTTGKYLLIGFINYTANATGYRGARFYKDNTTSLLRVVVPNQGASTVAEINISIIANLTAGSYVTLQAIQTSGGNLNANGFLFQAIKIS